VTDDLHRRDAAAHADLTAEVRRRFSGKKYPHHLDDDQLAELADHFAAELAADPADLDRRAKLYAAENGRRLIDRLRRDRDAVEAAAARPERDKLQEEVVILEHERMAMEAHLVAVRGRLELVRAKLAELAQGHDDQADEAVVVDASSTIKHAGRRSS
jgi:hypothetical protein